MIVFFVNEYPATHAQCMSIELAAGMLVEVKYARWNQQGISSRRVVLSLRSDSMPSSTALMIHASDGLCSDETF